VPFELELRRLDERCVRLPIAEWLDGQGGARLAFKSEDVPIENLRKIDGFIEAPLLHPAGA
jgi:hypothetical protein